MLIPRCQCEDIQIAFKIGCINNHNSVAKKKKKKKKADIHQGKTVKVRE